MVCTQTNLIVSKLETEDLCDRVTSFFVVQPDVDRQSFLFALVVARCLTRLITPRLGRPRRDSEEVEEELMMLYELVRERVEKNVEGTGRVEIKISWKRRLLSIATEERQSEGGQESGGRTDQTFHFVVYADRSSRSLLFSFPTLRSHDIVSRPHVAQELDDEFRVSL